MNQYFRCLVIICVLPILIFAGPILNDREKFLINHVSRAIENAENLQSKLTDEILSLEGMSGWKGRHFLNNLCTLDRGVYLEIGTYKGSTLVSALYGNENSIIHSVAIDNWSQFGGPKEEFAANIQKFIANSSLESFDIDCFSFPVKETFSKPVNIYFYDGNHDPWNQEKAFTYYNDIFDDVFIAVVDDWNWGHVRDGTFNAFTSLNYTVLFDKVIYTSGNGEPQGWWNGMYIAVIRKN